MKYICVFGLGWLGKQLVISLSNNGVDVLGVNRTIKNDLSIDQLRYDLNNPEKETIDLLKRKQFDLVIITVPPSSSDEYDSRMNEFASLFTPEKTKVIYFSSTSVYGSKSREIFENSLVDPITNNAKMIVNVENSIFLRYKENGLIIRLAGLIGIDRHPILYLSGKKNIKQPNAFVNLIYSEDIISLLKLLIVHWSGGIVNLCQPNHPTKQYYYNWMADQLRIPKPEFNNFDKSLGKRISSNRLKELNFTFNYKRLENIPLPKIK